MKKIIVLGLVLVALVISGCETFRGLGKDVEKTGQWVQDKAKK